jgi:glycosyltransferase involved in cell wall biosynthesis
MRISGFSFIRNGVIYDYPFLESLRSLLPLCDEVVLAVGQSDDDTLRRIEALNSPSIRIIPTVWDDSLREGGSILAQQTNIALDAVRGDWAVYLQADEVLHENDYDKICRAILDASADPRVEGLLFPYQHFYGSYEYVGASRRWYRNEVRVVRTGIGVRSWGDAQGFRIGSRKLKVKPVDAYVYHYGWVRPPDLQQRKQRSFHRYWHTDEWISSHVGDSEKFDYAKGGRLRRFTGTHPAVMKQRITMQDWRFEYDPRRAGGPFKDRVLDWLEEKTGLRPGEYRNYELL